MSFILFVKGAGVDVWTDFRETAPAAAFEDMYRGNWMGSVTSGLASGVPGDVKGLEYLHSKYGVSEINELKEMVLIV